MTSGWSKKISSSELRLSDGDVEFVDALAASFVPSFERLFGAARIATYLTTTLQLARRLNRSWYAFEIVSAEAAKHPDGAPSLFTVDIASVDQAHLVDSFRALLDRFGLEPKVTLHPLMTVKRDSDGQIIASKRTGTKDAPGRLESFIHFEFYAIESQLDMASLTDAIERVFRCLSLFLEDFSDLDALLAGARWQIGMLGQHPELFLVLGAGKISDGRLQPDSALGVLRILESEEIGAIEDAFEALGEAPTLIPVSSPMISNEAMIAGKCSAEKADIIVGVPSRRPGSFGDRAAKLLVEIGELLRIPQESYSFRELQESLAIIAEIEIAFAPEQRLYDGIASLLLSRETNQIVAYASSLSSSDALRIYVYVPTSRYRSGISRYIEESLRQSLPGATVFCAEARVDAKSARLDVDILKSDVKSLQLPLDDLISRVTQTAKNATRTWSDRLEDEAANRFPDQDAREICRRYQGTFDSTYQNDYSAAVGADDIRRIETALAGNGLWVGFTTDVGQKPLEEILNGSKPLRLRVIHLGEKQKLSSLLPLVETFGLSVVDEVPYQLYAPDSSKPVWLYDLGVETPADTKEIPDSTISQFAATFEEVFLGGLDADLLNSLVLRAGLDTHGVVLLRAIAYYQRFLVGGFSAASALDTVCAYPKIARALVEFFEFRFKRADESTLSRLHRDLVVELIDAVKVLEHDQFFRVILQIVDATLRTNLYVRASAVDPVVIKLNSKAVPGLVEPIPEVETFVFSPNVEGIHLRSSLVARGGIRYSDRKDDYRLEILGLMKAQAVKNSLIVPHGAKGGFVIRGTSSDDKVIERCYDAFVEGLLSVTDNIQGGVVVHPSIGPIYDGDDPYLVVAADKGTAAFSDRANALALEHDFWLGDAFASGGSAGYDHKAMGITAKGAWISVRQHFAFLGIDPELDPIDVVGIGDMSGDVFGNGMLLSKSVRLVAAFDHRDIFIDPDPDPILSLQERHRLFALARSSWKDYDPALISEGGGVFSRAAKSIDVGAPVAAVLGTDAGSYSPNELVRAILAAPVDLIWNGGIGTYVRSGIESNGDIGDKGNDGVRVPAAAIRAKVIAEGGNLGISQLARIELSRRGVLLNTDAIDNSAGVDTSDHEVNLKILYQHAPSLAGLNRDKLLNSLAGEVQQLVLADNMWQNWALSMAMSEFEEMVGAYAEFVTMLERHGGLDRQVEFLPGDAVLTSGYSITRPELSVLMAYEKLRVKSELASQGVESIPLLARAALSYFPLELMDRISVDAASHPLWPQLVANQLANHIVNVAGPTYLMRSVEESGLTVAAVAQCFVAAGQIFGTTSALVAIMSRRGGQFVEALDGFTQTARFHERATRWLMRDAARNLDIDIDYFRLAVQKVIEGFPEVLSPRYRQRFEAESSRFAVPPGDLDIFALARLAPFSTSIMEISRLTQDYPAADVTEVARVYFEVGEALAIPELLDSASGLARRSNWERQVRISVRDDLDSVHAQAFQRIMSGGVSAESRSRMAKYQDYGAELVLGWTAKVLPEAGTPELIDSDRLAMLVVATRRLRAMVESS